MLQCSIADSTAYKCLSTLYKPCVTMLQCSIADSTAYLNAHFGQGSTIIIAMDNVGCSGSEASLFSCSHSTSHNCGHNEDAGVQCVSRESNHNSSSLSTMKFLLLNYCRLYSWHNTASWWDIFPRESGSVCKWIVEYSVQP